jgi:hypothetical protein
MKLILTLLFFTFFSFANDKFINMKNCETFKLSKFNTLLSCHSIDYLIEYRDVDNEEKDVVKKITAITVNDQRIIKDLGKK